MKRITIYDVAKEADVSLATVSRVINGSQVVREDTRVKVQEAIEKLGYKPNTIAQSLALSKTTTIALIIPNDSYNYTGQVLNGLIDVAKIYQYNIMLHTTTAGINEMNDIIENVIKSNADGCIIFNDKLTEDEINKLNKYQVPIVVIGSKMSGDFVGSVYVDYAKIAFEIVNKYLAQGKDKIALIEDRKNPLMIKQLRKGMEEAFSEHGKTFNGYIEIPVEYRSSYKFLKDYVGKDFDYDLIVAYRDSQALAILNATNEAGYKIPDDLEVICVLDSKYNSIARPQITGYKIPDYDLGAVAMRLLTKLLDKDEELSDKEIELSYVYTPRKSTND